MSSSGDNDIPQWKKELIARLRSQNKRTATARQLVDSSQRTLVPTSTPTTTSSVQQPDKIGRERCDVTKMVQEKCWDKSDSDEDLHYGPGIVSKLKERYLSLAQRENKQRPTILRKAASLENILDDAPNNDSGANRLFQTRLNGSNDTKNATNRYRNTKRGSELKRARSVETISTTEEREKETKRESLHEEMLISHKEGNDKPITIILDKKIENVDKGYTPRINRPKRIPPVMNEKEKPPADVVKQAKMIFERRPEQRTRPPQQTGEVAAKVATYKSIIVQAKAAKKPAIKVKPVITSEKPKTNGVRLKKETEKTKPTVLEVSPLKSPDKPSLPSPIPDVSRIDIKSAEDSPNRSLSETPDLIITSSPLASINSPSYRISATENFLKEEIRLASNRHVEKKTSSVVTNSTFNFTKIKNHVPVNKNVLNTQTPPSQPLKLEINGINGELKPNLTIPEIEKNLINTAKALAKSGVTNKCEEVTINKVPKVKKPSRELENNSIVFKFTDRKDVPDYVQNDGVKRVAELKKPKVILLSIHLVLV